MLNTMKPAQSSPSFLSLALLIGAGIAFSLTGCGRSDQGDTSENATVTKDLAWCCENGDLEGVKSLLNGTDINGSGDQTPPLHLAAKAGHRNVAEFLISKGADINKTDRSLMGWTPLQYAASAGQADMIEYLLQMGAKMDVVAKNGDYPIHTAARYGHIPAIKKLMDADALPEQESGDEWGDSQRNEMSSDLRSMLNASAKYLPIHAAAQNNKPDVVKFLILGGTPPDAKDAHGNNVLHYATFKTGWTSSRAETIRLVDPNGEFEKAAAHTISTNGFYVTEETTPKFIRFMPEELVSDGGSSRPSLTQRVVISFGARGGTSPGEIGKWLYPYNEEADKQGDFITGTYRMMKGYVDVTTFDSDYQGHSITFRKEDGQLCLFMFGEKAACKFVAFK